MLEYLQKVYQIKLSFFKKCFIKNYKIFEGVYICGNSSTSSGLTVTLTKEMGSNDFALEPGALVLADQGCCCIDEFDKMCSQHQVK